MSAVRNWAAADIPSLAGKRALVTGGNRGLGYEIAAALARKGAAVVLACRDPAKGAAACARLRELTPHADVEAMQLDLAELTSVRRFADDFSARFASLDILCNNAAAIMVSRTQTKDGFEMHVGTNHLGHFALTGLLIDRLRTSSAARIVNMGSIAHRLTKGLDLEDPYFARRPYKEMDAYGQSKLAALSFTFELDRRLRREGAGIAAVAAHPGYTATNDDLGGFFMRVSTRLFAQAPAMGALPALYAATAADVQGGEYFGPGGFKELRGAPKRVEARPEARDAKLGAQLWEWSQAQIGIKYLDR